MTVRPSMVTGSSTRARKVLGPSGIALVRVFFKRTLNNVPAGRTAEAEKLKGMPLDVSRWSGTSGWEAGSPGALASALPWNGRARESLWLFVSPIAIRREQDEAKARASRAAHRLPLRRHFGISTMVALASLIRKWQLGFQLLSH